MLSEYSVSGKWLELLKQIAPELKRVAVLRHSGNPAGIAQFGAIQAVAPSLGLQVSPINVHDASEIERGVATFARSANGGLVVTGSATATIHRELIITLAARHGDDRVATSNVARTALIRASPTILAATAIVPSVNGGRRSDGWRRERRSCCPTTMSGVGRPDSGRRRLVRDVPSLRRRRFAQSYANRVSLLFANIRVIFGKNSELAAESAKNACSAVIF
jgi:hypothetical protein